jgi:hypothetical protein
MCKELNQPKTFFADHTDRLMDRVTNAAKGSNLPILFEFISFLRIIFASTVKGSCLMQDISW